MSLVDMYRSLLDGHDDACPCEICVHYRKPEVLEAFRQALRGDNMTISRIETIHRVTGDGYVRFIESWGTGRDGVVFDDDGHVIRRDCEVGIIEAARQSTQGSFRGWEQDQKLLNFLYANNHATPFEFAGMILEVQAPIFVFREWHRHRTQSYNEMSARYAPLPDLYYVPDLNNVHQRAQEAAESKNKQAGSMVETPPSMELCDTWLTAVIDLYNRAEFLYQSGLGMGIPKELARIPMPVGHYSRMRCQANLRNWLAFITLRADPKAQWEIQQYAFAVADMVRRTFPLTYKKFLETAPETLDALDLRTIAEQR